MKKQIFFLAVALVVIFSACSKMPNHAKYVPKNALFVATVDMNKLNKKLIWNAITGSELFNEMLKDLKNEDSKKAAKDISNIGLDQSSTVYAYYTGTLKAQGNFAVVIAMKDASKFESFIKKTYPSNAIEDSKEYKNCTIEENMVLAWNSDVLMVLPSKTIQPVAEFSASQSQEDSLEVMYNTASNEVNVNNAATLKTFIKEAFALKSENAITSMKNFKNLQSDNHDISFWMNYEEVYKNSKDLNTGVTAAFVKEEYFKDAALACGFDFEKGNIDGVMDYYMGKPLADIYGKYDGGKIKESLVKNIPSKDVALLLSYKLDPKMLKETLEFMKLDGMLNMGLTFAGTSMDKICETFTGDMVFALTDLKSKTTADSLASSSEMNMDMNMIFAMGIKDKDHVEKLLNKGVQSGAIVKNGNQYSTPANEKANMVLEKEMLVASSSKDFTANYLAGKGSIKEAVPSDVYEHVTSNMMGMYIDVKKAANAFPNNWENKTPEEKQLMEDAKNMLTYVDMYGGKMKNNATHMEGKLYFTNKDENALIQVLNFAVKANKVQEKNKALNNTTVTVEDSTSSY